jgi:drug/metabolite transporter (DMT)-like permease
VGPGVLFALVAALAFGATAPLVQRFAGGPDGTGPFWTAALLYAGAATFAFPRRSPGREARLGRRDAARLAAVAACGAFLAPVALAWGLRRTSGTSAALMLNLEAGLTVALGRLLYAEHVGRRVLFAAALIAGGGALLVFDRQGSSGADALGLGAVALATLGWALDNAIARPLADRDPGAVVLVKGALGAALSALVALALGDAPPRSIASVGVFACGAVGFGVSLRLYLLAQRRLGTARTASVFAVAPFVGALVAMAIGQPASPLVWVAAVTMALGVWLHATERHDHWHVHDRVTHEHAHRHDDGHHAHAHDPMPDGAHSHPHEHERLGHAHAHAEDLHHRHHR